MRKVTWILAVGAAAVVWAAQSGGLLSGFVKALGDAQSLNASYSSGMVSGTLTNIDLAFAKPNKARIETPSTIIIADGSSVLTYDKSAKTYYRDPQSAATINGLLQDESLNIWAPFFNAKALDKAATKSLGSKARKGVQYNAVEATFSGGKKKVTYYLDGAGIVRFADFTYGDTSEQGVLITKSVSLGGPANGALFAFNPPTGSRELTEEERYSGQWLHNLDEALALAKRTNRFVMVDFDAVWCGPCQKMKAEVYPRDDFKAFAKQFVFCEIDVDENPALAKQYGASSIPLVKFLKPDGTVFHSFVGYSSPAQVLGEMRKALSMAGN